MISVLTGVNHKNQEESTMKSEEFQALACVFSNGAMIVENIGAKMSDVDGYHRTVYRIMGIVNSFGLQSFCSVIAFLFEQIVLTYSLVVVYAQLYVHNQGTHPDPRIHSRLSLKVAAAHSGRGTLEPSCLAPKILRPLTNNLL